jgi:hypothetical protein
VRGRANLRQGSLKQDGLRGGQRSFYFLNVVAFRVGRGDQTHLIGERFVADLIELFAKR